MAWYGVKDHNNLLKDSHSKVVVNTDSRGLKEAKRQKQKALEQKKKLEEVDQLRSEVSRLSGLVEKLLDERNNHNGS